MAKKDWDFVLAKAAGAEWKPGLREIFDYRDLGIKAATKGDYVAHIIKANGKKMKDNASVKVQNESPPSYPGGVRTLVSHCLTVPGTEMSLPSSLGTVCRPRSSSL